MEESQNGIGNCLPDCPRVDGLFFVGHCSLILIARLVAW
jgi:hypothetical protein